MAVGFNVGFFWYQIGSGDFLHCLNCPLCQGHFELV